MDDLIAFITARLDEDEAAAKAAKGCKSGSWIASVDGDIFTDDDRFVAAMQEPAATHAMLHDPERVLREVEADRKLLAELEHAATADFGITGEPYDAGWYGALELAVRIRAERFSGHPDYPLPGGSHGCSSGWVNT